MKRSERYYRRLYFLANKDDIPIQTEIRERLGDALANVLFETCPESLRPLLGLEPPLVGAGDDLWISPSDLLIGKVRLTPPLTAKHVQALTHRGILEIGEKIEEKFWLEMDAIKDRALEENEILLRWIADRERRRAVEDARKEEQDVCNAEKARMIEEFDKKLEMALKNLKNTLRCENEIKVEEMRLRTTLLMLRKLEHIVEATVCQLSKQFSEQLSKQARDLNREFQEQLRKEEDKLQKAIAEEHRKCEECKLQLQHELECKNIANLMYVLCVERRRCLIEKRIMEKNFEVEIQDMENILFEIESNLKAIQKDHDENVRKVKARESVLKAVVREFQKFINFALRAVPTQAEYLLSVEKLLVYELTQAVLKSGQEIPPEPTEKEESSESSGRSLKYCDFHDCYNRIKIPESLHTLPSGEDLPAFHFNKHVYVREDFRNMVSQGLRITESDDLWNTNVKETTEYLTKQADDVMSLTASQTQRRSSVHFDVEDRRCRKPECRAICKVKANTPCEKQVSDPDEEKELTSYRLSSIDGSDNAYRQFVVIGHGSKDDEHIHILDTVKAMSKPKRATSFSVTTKSIDEDDLAYQIADADAADAVPPKTEEEQIHQLPSLTQDSLVFHRASLSKKRNSQQSGNRQRRPSRLVEARDSVELLLREGSIDGRARRLTKEKVLEGFSPITLRASRIATARDSFELIRQKSSYDKQEQSVSELNILGAVSNKTEIPVEEDRPKASPSTDRPIRQLDSVTSKLSMARNSVEIIKEKLSANKIVLQQTVSKLSMARDSVELMKTSSKHSRMSTPTGPYHKSSKPSVELFDGIIATAKPTSSIVRLSEDDPLKSVKMSHIEIFDFEKDKQKCSATTYVMPPLDIVHDPLEKMDSPWLIYENAKTEKSKSPRDDFHKKPNEAKILGDRGATEHAESVAKFTSKRMASLLTILKKEPSLMQLFTCGIK